MVGLVTAVGGPVVLIASVLFLAVQTRAVSEQVRVANNLAGTQALDSALVGLREVHFKMLEFPGLRAYFYDRKPVPRRGVSRERVMTLADLFADILDSGLQAARRIPDNESQDDWADYCRTMLSSSPALQVRVRQHPNWWPDLFTLI